MYNPILIQISYNASISTTLGSVGVNHYVALLIQICCVFLSQWFAMQRELRERRPKSPLSNGKCRCIFYCSKKLCDNAVNFGEECDEFNCGSKGQCGNKAFLRTSRLSDDALDDRIEARPTDNNGSGLFTLEDVKKGAVICEYDGKILTKQQFQKQQARTSKTKSDKMAGLPDGRFVDAGHNYRFAGFIEHSVEPNCYLIPRRINMIERIFIVAARDIMADHELFLNFCGDRKPCQLPLECNCQQCVAGIIHFSAA